MPYNNFRTIAQITDGLSNTVFIVECAGRSDFICTEQTCATGDAYESGAWAGWENGFAPSGSNFDGSFTNGTGACTMNCTNYSNSGPRQYGNIYSFHPGGCNFLWGDGSVRFLKQTIPWNVLCAYLTAFSGEVVSEAY